ncbi:hypothetical protein [Streptomyces sp. NPDC001388]|uniref:hypothetical protein n=1 Tax=Streptomyces sp. NPDC001388 TaxID=3364568 RepID=UPI00368305D7
MSEPAAGGPRWQSPHSVPPPGPPGRKRRGRGCLWGCAGALAAVLVIVVAVLVIAGEDGDEATTPAPSGTTSPRTPQAKTQEPRSERADLISFQLDDRSAAGITDIWVVWTIRNSTSEKSDYAWDWEAVDADGTRLENGTELETDVLPGQTARGDSFTTLNSTKGIHLNITGFNRTVSY